MGDLTGEGPAGPTIGIVCGLASERRCAERALGDARARAIIHVSGASTAQAARAATELVEAGVSALVSFGLAGALDPDLSVADVIIARRVASTRGTFGPEDGSIVWGSDIMVASPQGKADLHASSGAAIVDMESHAVALAAETAELPLIVIRAVSDDAKQHLMGDLATAIDPAGQPRIGQILRGLARHPGRLPVLLRLARDTNRALAALEEAAKGEFDGLFRSLDTT